MNGVNNLVKKFFLKGVNNFVKKNFFLKGVNKLVKNE